MVRRPLRESDPRSCLALAVERGGVGGFQSRTLKATQTYGHWEVIIYGQGFIKVGVMRQGLMGEWDCPAHNRFGQPELTNFGVATREMGLGTLRRCTTMLRILLGSNQFAQNQNSNTLRGAGNGLGRTQRIHNAGCPSGRALQVQMASINKGKKRQKDPIPTAGPIPVLTQVSQLVLSLPLDPQVKEQLQVSLRGHVEPAQKVHR